VFAAAGQQLVDDPGRASGSVLDERHHFGGCGGSPMVEVNANQRRLSASALGVMPLASSFASTKLSGFHPGGVLPAGTAGFTGWNA
jgi:hypothetical protein